jgi:tricorn protease
MSGQGYYRFPTIHGGSIVFTSEDDLWEVAAEGGTARRLTAGMGRALYPRYSPDGTMIAFSARDEGPLEVYVMPAAGGPARRLTYMGATAFVCGWSPAGEVLFSSSAAKPFPRFTTIRAVSPTDGAVRELPIGHARTASIQENGATVLGRYGMVTREPAYWKRYRGGTAGDLWIDPDGSGTFHRLIELDGNLTDPLWLGGRVYFTSDHDGIGNLYSVSPTGNELTRHTDHEDYYVRHPSTDGRRIVYHAGADLYLFDPGAARAERVEVDYPSPRTERNRKFVDPARYWEEYTLHPKGHLLAAVVRGKPFFFGPWEGPVTQRGEAHGVRYRAVEWLADGERIVLVSDAEGEEHLEVHPADPRSAVMRFRELELGRIQQVVPAPVGSRVAVTNHRRELFVVDVDAGTADKADESEHFVIGDPAWSPDGRWLAYSFQRSLHQAELRLYDMEAGSVHPITEPILRDGAPVFDPDGKYLYFLSQRDLNPVYDSAQFDLGFPASVKPYLLTLRSDLDNPFLPQPQPQEEQKRDAEAAKNGGARNGDRGDDGPGDGESDGEAGPDGGETEREPTPVEIELGGIAGRVLPFPVEEGRFRQIAALSGKVLFSTVPVEGMLSEGEEKPGPPAKATLTAFDFKTQQKETQVKGLTSFMVSADRKKLAYRAGNKLRVITAGPKPDENNSTNGPGRKSGWVDLSRIRPAVEPPAEWAQMLREAWRLQRDNFWNESMSGVDWRAVYERYLPLVDRVSTRSEFSDLTWEMQGELGTSHAYEFGGDYRPQPQYALGFLGADLSFDGELGAWRIDHVVQGDTWKDGWGSPLARAGAGVAAGQTLLAVNGRPADALQSPHELLLNQAGCEVSLTIGDARGESPRTVVVRTLSDDRRARYREWVESNRRTVHERTGGRAGYIHIPDMMPNGYAEFHRSYLPEVDRRGLVVDVRFNGGGHVSALLLEKLARRRMAYVASRWFGVEPWPEDSPPRPMVAITNEWAGSDGDIFSHSFKMLELGPLIGVRTWGGVIGIWPRQQLVDRTMTSQPEFSFWFTDVGWQVENRGTEPDIKVEITPQDYGAGQDPQLDRAVTEVERLMGEHTEPEPDISSIPNRELPRLPRRPGAE